jgi:tRNA A37 methylthiotransferase MiaB
MNTEESGEIETTLMPKTVAILTNNTNCERHVQYYTSLEKYFMANGWVISETFDVDMVVISGCGFHNMMLEKVKSLLADLNTSQFKGELVMTGCIPTTHKEEWRQGFNGTLVELSGEAALDGLIGAAIPYKDLKPVNVLKPHKDVVVKDEDRVLHVKIADGCMRQCSFCVIHKAKGKIRSFSPDSVYAQIEKGVKAGYKTIFLMGEDTFAYGVDAGSTIIDLVEGILGRYSNLTFQFGNLDHRWLVEYTDQIIDLCQRGVITQVHVGMQHNDDRLLIKMGRGGIAFERIYQAIVKLKTACPQLYLGVDIIVGFPGETEEMFNALMTFFETEPHIDNVQHNGYSAISGAPAAEFGGQVAAQLIASRWYRMTRMLRNRTAFNRSNQSSNFDVTFRDTRDRAYSFVKDSVMDLDIDDSSCSVEPKVEHRVGRLPVIN